MVRDKLKITMLVSCFNKKKKKNFFKLFFYVNELRFWECFEWNYNLEQWFTPTLILNLLYWNQFYNEVLGIQFHFHSNKWPWIIANEERLLIWVVRNVSSYLVVWDLNTGYVTSFHLCRLFFQLCGLPSRLYGTPSDLDVLTSCVYAGSLLITTHLAWC